MKILCTKNVTRKYAFYRFCMPWCHDLIYWRYFNNYLFLFQMDYLLTVMMYSKQMEACQAFILSAQILSINLKPYVWKMAGRQSKAVDNMEIQKTSSKKNGMNMLKALENPVRFFNHLKYHKRLGLNILLSSRKGALAGTW